MRQATGSLMKGVRQKKTMNQNRRPDWQCILVRKVTEDAASATYQFISDIWVPDPQFQSRYKIDGQGVGLLRIAKPTGELSIIEPMKEDISGKVAQRAGLCIEKHWRAGEYPDVTQYCCG